MTTSTLHAVIDEHLHLSPEYGDALSDHLPMALHALHRLGASEGRLRAFAETYERKIRPGGSTVDRSRPEPAAQAPMPLAMLDMSAHLGRYESLTLLQRHFAQAVQRQGVDATLRQSVPILMRGVGAAAFHGLLRTAHAFESGHREGLALSLGYWAARWFELETPSGPAQRQEDFSTWKAALADQSAGWSSNARLIFLRMQEATSSAPYRALADGPARDPRHAHGLLAPLAGAAVEVYADTGNFTALHMVTGCRAVRVLMPWAGDSALVMTAIVHAWTAAWLASGVGRARRLPAPPMRSWPEIVAAAIASDDEHVVKLVDACRQEAAYRGEGRYREAAARAVEASFRATGTSPEARSPSQAPEVENQSSK